MTVTVFGYLITISMYMHFFDFISLVSPKLVLVSIKKFVKNTLLRIIFSSLFSVFGNTVMFLIKYLL